MSNYTFFMTIKQLGCLDSRFGEKIFYKSFYSVIHNRLPSVGQSGVKDKSVFLGVDPIRGITHKHVISSSGKALCS